jgi:hypothetical protein
MGRVLVYVVPVALAIYALIDLWRSRPEERAGLHPALWAAIIVLLPVLGPIAWILTSVYLRYQNRAAGGPGRGQRPARGGPARPGRPPRRQGPVAPDDDPDFLWRLERERRRREAGPGAPGPGAPEPTPEAGGAVPDQPSPGDDRLGDDRLADDRLADDPRDDGRRDDDGSSGRGSGRDAGAGKDDDGRG